MFERVKGLVLSYLLTCKEEGQYVVVAGNVVDSLSDGLVVSEDNVIKALYWAKQMGYVEEFAPCKLRISETIHEVFGKDE